jgi:HlyD family secretion protein
MNLRNWFTKKRIIIGSIIALVVIVGAVFSRGGNDVSNILTEKVKKTDLKQTVLATGQVTSTTDLSLSFKGSGVVDKVFVKVGDTVKNGSILAQLQQRDQSASLISARGALASANANYQRVLEGASSEEVIVSQRAVDSALVTLENAKNNLAKVKSQQETAVKNAYLALLNSTNAAIPNSGNLSGMTPTISGTYNGSAKGSYVLSVSSGRYYVNGLESSSGTLSTSLTVLGTKGLYFQFSSITPALYSGNDSWTIEIPNTQASNYVTNLNIYNAALETQSSSVSTAESTVSASMSSYDQAIAALNLKKAQARPADVSAARAQILSAQGQVASASAALENTIIRAPADGTITTVDVKVGELATALQPLVVLQDVVNLHVESNISEANIANVKPGQVVEITLDALGPDRNFKGTVQTIDPSSTVVSGVVNYKVIASLEKLPEIKPGMTANMTILVSQKDGVLSVPSRSVLNENGKKQVRVITDSKKKTYENHEVTLGIEADGGLVEITSGLEENQEIVTFINKK